MNTQTETAITTAITTIKTYVDSHDQQQTTPTPTPVPTPTPIANVGTKLLKLRTLKKATTTSVGKVLGKTSQYVLDLESNKVALNSVDAGKLAIYYGVTVESLI